MRRARLLPCALCGLTLLALVAAMLTLGAAPLLARPEPAPPSQPASPHPGAEDEPDIVVTPGFLGQALCRDSTAAQLLTICNQGGAALTWAIGESGGLASDVPWLSEDPTGGSLAPGACQEVIVIFDAAGLFPGPYMAHLIVASDDPDTPEVEVPVFLSVPEPVYSVDFSWQPLEPAAGEAVTFSASAAGDGPIEFAWDLGDGTTGSGAGVVHRYGASGDYPVTLTAANACGQTSAQQVVAVGPAHTWLPLVTR